MKRRRGAEEILQLAMPDYRRMLEQCRDAYNRRDPDAWLAVWHPDCEWHPILTRREGHPGYHGQCGVRDWFEAVDEMYEYAEFDVDFDDLRQIGGRVLVRGKFHAKGRGSGAEITTEVGWVVEPRGERFQRGYGYLSYEDARRAAEEATVEGGNQTSARMSRS